MEEDMKVLARIHQNVRPKSIHKTRLQISFIAERIAQHFIFTNLSPFQIHALAKAMMYCQLEEAAFLFQQGSQADSFFILQEGTCQVLLDGKVGRTLNAPDGFGETALLGTTVRTTSVRAVEKCTLWMIDRTMAHEVLGHTIAQQNERNRGYLQKLRFFNYLSNSQKDRVSSSMVKLKFRKDQNLVEENDPGSAFYVITSGMATIISNEQTMGKLYPGDSFGQCALYYNIQRKASIRADCELTCLALCRQSLINIFGKDFNQIVFQNIIKTAVAKCGNELDIEQFTLGYRIMPLQAGERLVSKTDVLPRLYVIIDGNVKAKRQGHIVCQSGHLFGLDFIVKGEKLIDDYQMQSDGVVIQLPEIKAQQILKKPKALPKALKRFPVKKINKFQHRTSCQNCQLYKVTCQEGIRYAVKEYTKQHHPHVRNQVQCLSYFDGSNIVGLQGLWQNKEALFVAINWVQGMELYEVIRSIGLLSTEDAQFYVCSMLLILQELKLKTIIHRDLKPQNLILKDDGELMLVGLSCAKRTTKTSTVIGTPHYMAPEVILGKMYGWTVDLWAIGIMLFQMMCGYVPFGDQHDSPTAIFDSILKQELQIPDTLTDKRAKRVMQQMLSRDYELRFGGSFNLIWQDEWIKEGQPGQIRERQRRAPSFDGQDWSKKLVQVSFDKKIVTVQDAGYPEFNQ